MKILSAILITACAIAAGYSIGHSAGSAAARAHARAFLRDLTRLEDTLLRESRQCRTSGEADTADAIETTAWRIRFLREQSDLNRTTP